MDSTAVKRGQQSGAHSNADLQADSVSDAAPGTQEGAQTGAVQEPGAEPEAQADQAADPEPKPGPPPEPSPEPEPEPEPEPDSKPEPGADPQADSDSRAQTPVQSPVQPADRPADEAQPGRDPERDRLLGIRVIAFVTALCVLVVGWALIRVGRQTGTGIATPAGTAPRQLIRLVADRFTLPGSPAAMPWPAAGQAAAEIEDYGSLGTSGDIGKPVPIASVTKTMTAYLILAHHPLADGSSGPLITISSADAAAYAQEAKQGQSLVKVKAGERISERDALEALMLASADNIAKILARWDAGSSQAFVSAMNNTARALGMTHTTYTDPSGLDPATVSTATDQIALGRAAIRSATFRAIVSEQSASIPVQGVIRNYNRLVGHNGVFGIKTGSTDQAGGCLLFAGTFTVGGRTQTVVGAILGQPLGTGGGFLDGTLNAASKLIAGAQGTIVAGTVAVPGDLIAGVRPAAAAGGETLLGVAKPVVVVGRPGQTYRVSLSGGAATPVLTVKAVGPVGTPSVLTRSLSVPLVRASGRGAVPAE